MSDIKQELDKIRGRISEPSFLKNEGLSNEVGIHVFCYDPADELIVRDRGRAGRKTRKGIPSQAASKDRNAGGASGIHEV